MLRLRRRHWLLRLTGLAFDLSSGLGRRHVVVGWRRWWRSSRLVGEHCGTLSEEASLFSIAGHGCMTGIGLPRTVVCHRGVDSFIYFIKESVAYIHMFVAAGSVLPQVSTNCLSGIGV